jgi:hypothetical protein
MTEEQENVTHVIKFEPELTENQEKAMRMVSELSYLNGKMEECGNIAEIMDHIVNHEGVLNEISGSEDDAGVVMEVLTMMRNALSQRGFDIFDKIKELSVDAS